MCENLTSEFVSHKNCRRQASILTYSLCRFYNLDDFVLDENCKQNWIIYQVFGQS